MRRPSPRTTVLLAAAAVVTTTAGGVAYAAIPSSTSGTISGCYVTTTGPTKGALKVIDAQAGATCPAGTAPLTWNVKGLSFRGAWLGTTAYKVNDVVTSGGQTYVAKTNNTGVGVGNLTNWALLAAKGADGARGPQGPAGPRGPAGPTSAGAFLQLPIYSSSTVNTWQTVGTTTYAMPAGGNLLARVAAESQCVTGAWCSVRVLVDGVEAAGGSGSSFAFDDGDPSSTYEAHALDRYAAGLAPGVHTVEVQAQNVGGGATSLFRLDDATLVLQTLG